jgi:phage-related protein
MVEKPVVWLGNSLEDVRAFPVDARRVVGFQLYRIQQGLEATDWKPVSSVGHGVREMRVHTNVEHRVLFVARFEEAIYVLHAFEKKARKTPKRDLEVAARRLRELIRERKDRNESKGSSV